MKLNEYSEKANSRFQEAAAQNGDSEHEPIIGDAVPIATPKERIKFPRITAAELASETYDNRYIIEGLLADAQPGVILGPAKALKTSIALDAAISIATAGHFLGFFRVHERKRVGIMSGESGLPVLQETANRICSAAGVELANTGIIFSDRVPIFGHTAHMVALEEWLKADEIELLFIDPTYLAMQTDGNEGSLFKMGELLRSVSESCQSVGATPVLLHHMKKTVANPFEPGELSDASWSGFCEFSRQWWCVNRREKYAAGSGLHRLWFSVGGSAGHSGLWGLDIDEGPYQPGVPRRWDVRVLKSDEIRHEEHSQEDAAKETRKQEQLDRDKRSILSAVARLPEHRGTLSTIRVRAGRNGQAFSIAFAELVANGDLIPIDILKGNNRTYEGFALGGQDP